jgi:hypothetical protein
MIKSKVSFKTKNKISTFLQKVGENCNSNIDPQVRYTPFGDGLVTLVLNTLVRRENNLMLWNTHNLMSPVHTFYGHTDMVLEFGYCLHHPGVVFYVIPSSGDRCNDYDNIFAKKLAFSD